MKARAISNAIVLDYCHVSEPLTDVAKEAMGYITMGYITIGDSLAQVKIHRPKTIYGIPLRLAN